MGGTTDQIPSGVASSGKGEPDITPKKWYLKPWFHTLVFTVLPCIVLCILFIFITDIKERYLSTFITVVMFAIIASIATDEPIAGAELPKLFHSIALSSTFLFVSIQALYDFDSLRRLLWTPDLKLDFRFVDNDLSSMDGSYDTAEIVFVDTENRPNPQAIDKDLFISKKEYTVPGYFADYKFLFVTICQTTGDSCYHSSPMTPRAGMFMDMEFYPEKREKLVDFYNLK